MRKYRFIAVLFILIFSTSHSISQTPVEAGGKLKVIGNQLSSECDKPIQLRGMSTHGIQWFKNCYNEQALDSLVNDWGIDLFRIATYIQTSSQGYNSDPTWFKNKIDELVELCAKKQIYCIIDWHSHTYGNPMVSIEEAKEFWEYMSKKHAGKKHVIYEICNEPNNDENGREVPWSTIKEYAETIIPIIRKNDPETVIVVGTPSWSGKPWNVIGDELGKNEDPSSPNYIYNNIMYTFHFYAGSHSYKKSNFKNVISKLPIFVTEWGTSDASGDDKFSEAETRDWIDILSGNNDAGVKISWANWSFADKDETSAALIPGACRNKLYNSTSKSGTLLRELLKTPEDNFLRCSDEPQIINELSDAIINEGQNHTFRFNVTGPNLVYTWYKNDIEITKTNSSELTVLAANIEDNLSTYKVIAENEEGKVESSATLNVLPKGPFSGSPIVIPGRLEVENYDIGGAGVTYVDADEGNNGNSYRTDDVDISLSGDEDGSHSIGWTNTDEWLDYTVNVTESDIYTFQFRTTNLAETGVIRILLDDNIIINRQEIEPTGSWSNWETTSVSGIELTEGVSKLRLYITEGPININYIDILKSSEVNGIFDRTYDNNGISLYPNPTNGILNISSDQISLANAKIEVLDMTGVTILNTSGNSEINVTSLDAGMYMLRVTAENKEVYLKWLKK